jgi:hypothetical protein
MKEEEIIEYVRQLGLYAATKTLPEGKRIFINTI